MAFHILASKRAKTEGENLNGSETAWDVGGQVSHWERGKKS